MVMGIVNLSPDSFSGDGLSCVDAALERALGLVGAGAEIIDVGAESARTNRGPIPVGEEVERLCGFVERWKALGSPALLSINTWRPEVAEPVLTLGGDLLNDIGGLPDGANAELCARVGAALLIMHSVGQPKVAHTHIGYPEVWRSVETFFEEKLALAEASGLSRESILLDPGLDFAKQRADNLRLLASAGRLHRFGRPILLPVSRKTVIGDVLGIPDASQRDAGTMACLVQGVLEGCHIFRVHEVRAAVAAIRVLQAIGEAG
ncbi:MAG: dihydropteroate synthase [Verrucomicrobiota bacterium]